MKDLVLHKDRLESFFNAHGAILNMPNLAVAKLKRYRRETWVQFFDQFACHLSGVFVQWTRAGTERSVPYRPFVPGDPCVKIARFLDVKMDENSHIFTITVEGAVALHGQENKWVPSPNDTEFEFCGNLFQPKFQGIAVAGINGEFSGIDLFAIYWNNETPPLLKRPSDRVKKSLGTSYI